MTLNEKIINLLKEHPEGGEKFFNALDLLIRSDRAILDDFVTWSIAHVKNFCGNWAEDNLVNTKSVGVILTGRFGNAVLSNYLSLLDSEFADIIIVNGGIREGAVPEIYRQGFNIKRYILLDDSFYSGTTMLSIEKAMQSIDPEVQIIHTCVIYDGGKEKRDNVSSLYKYYS